MGHDMEVWATVMDVCTAHTKAIDNWSFGPKIPIQEYSDDFSFWGIVSHGGKS